MDLLSLTQTGQFSLAPKVLTSQLALKVKMRYQYWCIFKGNLSEDSYESDFLRVDKINTVQKQNRLLPSGHPPTFRTNPPPVS